MRRSKKTSKLRVTGLCVGNSPVPGEFPTQRASNAENVSIWWHHHGNVSWRLLPRLRDRRLYVDINTSQWRGHITVTSHESHGVSNHRQMHWAQQLVLTNTETRSNTCVADLWEGNPPIIGGSSDADSFSWNDASEFLSPWWRHQMETFPALLTLCEGNPPVTGLFPLQKPVTRSFDVLSDRRLNKNGWANKRGAGDLRRHCAHYDINVMSIQILSRCVHTGLIDNNLGFGSGKVMVRRWTGDKPLPEVMMPFIHRSIDGWIGRWIGRSIHPFVPSVHPSI